MTLHAVDLLNIIIKGTQKLNNLKSVVDHSSIGVCLDLHDSYVLSQCTTLEEMQKIAMQLRPKYIDIWKNLGSPKTAEEWIRKEPIHTWMERNKSK
jgi:hypothetical protein